MGKVDTLVVYKALTEEGRAPAVPTYVWPLPSGGRPGAWVEVDTKTRKIAMCQWGLHGWLTRAQAEKNYPGRPIYEMELEGAPIIKNSDKAVGNRARLVRQLSGKRTVTLGEIAAAIALDGHHASALEAAADHLGLEPAVLEKALPGDLYLVDANEELKSIAQYLRTNKALGDEFAKRVWALDRFPLKVEFRAA